MSNGRITASAWGPREVGNYQLGVLIGRGPLGLVLEARYRGDAPWDLVAKFIPVLRDQQLIAGLREDASALGALAHRGIWPLVEVFGFGGYAVLVMPRASSGSLSRRLASCTHQGVTEVGAWLCEAADALACLHGAGIIHGDIRPSTLLFDQSGGCWIAGTGVWRRLVGPERSTSHGVLEYLDPAILAGGRAGDRSDVYSLGAVAYRALFGRPLTPGDRLRGPLDCSEMRRPRPESGGLSRPPELLYWLARALSPRPGDRPSSGALADGLRKVARRLSSGGVLSAPLEAPLGPRALTRSRSTSSRPDRSLALQPTGTSNRTPKRRSLGSRFGRFILGAGLATCATGAALGLSATQRRTSSALSGEAGLCPPATEVQVVRLGSCVEVVSWKSGVATVIIGDGVRVRRYLLGRPGDDLVVGDWYCSGHELPAVYQPDTGEVVFYRSWPGDGPAHSTVVASHVVGGSPRALRLPGGPCQVVRVTAPPPS